jgi:hypothetical protein
LFEFVSVEINGLGNFLEQSKMYTLTAFGPLKSCGGGYSARHDYTFRITGRTLTGVLISL